MFTKHKAGPFFSGPSVFLGAPSGGSRGRGARHHNLAKNRRGNEANIKITRPIDLRMAETLLQGE